MTVGRFYLTYFSTINSTLFATIHFALINAFYLYLHHITNGINISSSSQLATVLFMVLFEYHEASLDLKEINSIITT